MTGLELCGEWMCKKVILCTLFVCFQGVIENLLEVRGRGGSGLRVGRRHRYNDYELFAMRATVRCWGDWIKGTDMYDRRPRQTKAIDRKRRS